MATATDVPSLAEYPVRRRYLSVGLPAADLLSESRLQLGPEISGQHVGNRVTAPTRGRAPGPGRLAKGPADEVHDHDVRGSGCRGGGPAAGVGRWHARAAGKARWRAEGDRGAGGEPGSGGPGRG